MPAGRNAKPIELVKGHRTKAEKALREGAENALKTSMRCEPCDEVRASKRALARFERLKTIFASVDMDEAFYEEGLNRYCLMQNELAEHLKERRALAKIAAADPDFYAVLVKKDGAIAKLRDQLMIWERDNLMTVQGKLRAIPKTPQADDDVSGIEAFMKRRQG